MPRSGSTAIIHHHTPLPTGSSTSNGAGLLPSVPSSSAISTTIGGQHLDNNVNILHSQQQQQHPIGPLSGSSYPPSDPSSNIPPHPSNTHPFGANFFLPTPSTTMQVPSAGTATATEMPNPQPGGDPAVLQQQYAMLMNQQHRFEELRHRQQQQQRAAAAAMSGDFRSPEQLMWLYNAAINPNDPNNLAINALQSPSIDLSQAAFALNERRQSSQFLPPPPQGAPSSGGPAPVPSSIHPQLTPVHQTPPMLSPLLQAVQQHQQAQQQIQAQQAQAPPQAISQQSIEELAALSQLNPNILQANLLNELQREVQRQQQAAAAAVAAQQQAQHLHSLQAALQQANVPPGHAQQLLSVLQQQQQQQQVLAQQQQGGIPGGLFGPGNAIRPSPLKQALGPPQASPLLKAAPPINPINGIRFPDDPMMTKKLSQPQLPNIPLQPSTSAALPKRASFSAQAAPPPPRKPSIVAAPATLAKPIPTSINKAPPLLPSTSSQPGPSAPGPSATLPQQPYYPTHFLRGTSIRLENGETRLIEDMKADDFYNSSLLTDEMRVCQGEITAIKPTACCRFINISYKMEIEDQPALGNMTASVEYPFYESENGWSSYDPFKTLNLYGLQCKKLEVGDKCILLSKDFGDKDDAELKKKWQKQFKGQFRSYAKSQALGNDDVKDHPMERIPNGNQSMNRLIRKSIPPPLAMSSGFLTMTSTNGPTTSQSTSDSYTPLTSTISAPADTYLSNHAFALSTPNEPISAPAAMDDLTVDAQMAQAANANHSGSSSEGNNTEVEAMQVDEPPPIPKPVVSQPDNVFLDFSI